MPVTIGELSTTIETLPGDSAERGSGGSAPADDTAFEVRIEDLRALVRALVAEELERQLRHRGDCP
ncbi:hypothetical protein [Zoogloea sp.]|jgi:hypothetical protein|uniref:hypothetical protein n=1 Tax=Zoogloea sp. TaxID=49181 RepID=UPI0035B29630